MNQFELFCMIFYALDASLDDRRSETVLSYLSDANPFLFADNGSAVPEIYDRFCDVIRENVTIENCYDLAVKYIDTLADKDISEAFHRISRNEWISGANAYLSSPHKGQEEPAE